MFIVSKKSFGVRRADGTLYRIAKDFVGNIPDDVAKAKIIELAIKEGSIVKAESKKDAAVDMAIKSAEDAIVKDQADKEKKATENDPIKKDSKKK